MSFYDLFLWIWALWGVLFPSPSEYGILGGVLLGLLYTQELPKSDFYNLNDSPKAHFGPPWAHFGPQDELQPSQNTSASKGENPKWTSPY